MYSYVEQTKTMKEKVRNVPLKSVDERKLTSKTSDNNKLFQLLKLSFYNEALVTSSRNRLF